MPSKACTTVDRILFPAGRSFCAAVGFVLIASVGCHQVNNPWKDSSAVVDSQMTTPNAEIYIQTEPSPPRNRGGTPAQFTYATGETTHWPQWFADPFNDKGNDETMPDDRDVTDTRFAVNSVDYLHIAYGPARMLLNIAGFPVSAIVDWPGKLQASDARLSPQTFGRVDHDHRNVKSDEVDAPDMVTVREAPQEMPDMTTTTPMQ